MAAAHALEHWRAGLDEPPAPCTRCNKCLMNAPKNPMGCYEESRYPSREAMVDELMSIYETKAELRIPEPIARAAE